MVEQFGKYQLLRKIAIGGMAEVFLGSYEGPEGFKKYVAIKRILPHLTEDSDFVTMFLDEARLVARFTHPNIVQIFELGRVAGSYFLAMEFIDGKSMSKIIRACKKKKLPFPIEYGAKIVSHACGGLDYAHNFTDADGTLLNLIHRDVSPQNVMLSYDGVIKVLDFGIAKASGNLFQTRTTSLKGKAAYMSPEQITQKEGLDRRSDLFALGIVLYEFATGKRPFDGTNELELMMSIVQSDAKDPRTREPTVPDELAEIIMKALAKDREERYQTARELRSDLEAFLMHRQVLVDSYTLGSFLQDALPRGEQEVGYSPSSPSNSSMKAIPAPDLTVKDAASSKPKSGPQKRVKIPPIPKSKVPSPPLTSEEEDATVFTPSGMLRPVKEKDDAVPTSPAAIIPGGPLDKTGSKKRGLGIGLILFLLLAASGVGGFLFYKNQDTNGDVTTDEKTENHETVTPDIQLQKAMVIEAKGQTPPAQLTTQAENKPEEEKIKDNGNSKAEVEEKKKPTRKKRRKKRKRIAKLIEKQPEKKPEKKSIVQPEVPPKKTALIEQVDKGFLAVNSIPAAEVRIGKSSYGNTPMLGTNAIELAPGVHTVVLSNRDLGISHRQTVKILSGKRQQISKTFQKGYLQVYVKPFGKVFVDGQPKGETPLGSPIPLYEGTHKLMVKSPRTAKSKNSTVRIKPGQTTTVKMDLR